jgi:acetyltransferase-like isoleucine patch superfamily enzyme
MTLELGRHTSVGQGDITARVSIGAFTSIAKGVRMHRRIQHPCIEHPELVSTGANQAILGYPEPTLRDQITIGSDVWIGRDAVLLGGIEIGHGAIVGAYAVVAKDVPPYAVVVGNPARVIRYRFDQPTINRLLALRWWEWDDETVKSRAAELRDVGALIEGINHAGTA